MQFKHIFVMTFFLSLTHVAQAASSNAVEDKLEQCNQALSEGDAAKALLYAGEVLAQQANNREALLCKGRAHSDAGQYQQALAAMQVAEQQSVTPIERIVALTLIGNAHKSAKHFDEALATYRRSLSIAQAEQDKLFQRINHNLIGETLVETNQLEAGLESFLAGSELAANDTERADSYARIAETYSSLGKHDLAIEYQIKTVLSEERGGDFNRFANANLELGRMHTVAADYVNAEKVLNRIIERSKTQGAPYWEAKGYYYMALEKVANGQPEAAKTLLAQAEQIAKKIGADVLSTEVSQTLSKMSQ